MANNVNPVMMIPQASISLTSFHLYVSLIPFSNRHAAMQAHPCCSRGRSQIMNDPERFEGLGFNAGITYLKAGREGAVCRMDKVVSKGIQAGSHQQSAISYQQSVCPEQACPEPVEG